MVRTAASAEHGDLRVPQPDVAVLRAEFNRIAVIEIGRVIELLVAPPRSVSANAAYALGPRRAGRHDVFEVRRVGAVD